MQKKNWLARREVHGGQTVPINQPNRQVMQASENAGFFSLNG